MKKVLIIGSGISALSCAITCAELGMQVNMISSAMPERSQSVMAEGGINAAINQNDSPQKHAEDTIKAACGIENEADIKAMCESAAGIINWLDKLGTVFSRTKNYEIAQRAFGGQSFNRTCFSGTCTGKQLMSSLIAKARQLTCEGKLEQNYDYDFCNLIIRDGVCCGANFIHKYSGEKKTVYADAVVMATGGMNAMFKYSTGSILNTGYAAAILFKQGVEFRNLEFVQYHPTTVEVNGKSILISEAARGEGGRLYYEDGGKKVYFMEDAYGEKGNLMPRDIVARHVYSAPSQVYLDFSSISKEDIQKKLPELYDLCKEYLGKDITKESIPVKPSVHFFMGGIAVDSKHRTNIDRLYAIGECASKYHGANRLGGNSLLAALYSGKLAANDITSLSDSVKSESIDDAYPRYEFLENIADIMQESMGIVRTPEKLQNALDQLNKMDKENPFVLLGMAFVKSAIERKESRGAHYRTDYPESKEEFCKPSFALCKDDEVKIEI